MKKEEYDKLQDQVWTTRVSRINAEKRLKNKETFFQGINIYYSCCTIIFSILSLINKDDRLSLMTVIMTISLLIVILYLNSQKYLERAREYRKNYTELQKIEFQFKHIDESKDSEIQKIESRYCELLDTGENHISFDYYCTVHGSSGSYREARWKEVKWSYYINFFWRKLLELFLVILPVIIYILSEVSNNAGSKIMG